MKRPGKQSLRDALIANGGVVAAVAQHYQVSRQTIYHWIALYELDGVIDEARDALFRTAEDNILKAVLDGDVDVSKFVVQHMPSSRRRWGGRVDVTTAAIPGATMSEEVQQLMREQGIEAAEVWRAFEELVWLKAAESGSRALPNVIEGKARRKKQG